MIIALATIRMPDEMHGGGEEQLDVRRGHRKCFRQETGMPDPI